MNGIKERQPLTSMDGGGREGKQAGYGRSSSLYAAGPWCGWVHLGFGGDVNGRIGSVEGQPRAGLKLR